MAEQVIHFGQEYHTGHLREAASELFYQGLEVIDSCDKRVRSINPALEQLKTATLLRLALSPQSVPEKTRQKWDKSEAWVTRLLVSAHIMSYPNRAQMKIGEYMDGVSKIESTDEAIGFLNYRRRRLTYFLSDQGQKQFDSLRLASHAFEENYTVRRALNDGVYLMRVG
jgi:hypothetical protein